MAFLGRVDFCSPGKEKKRGAKDIFTCFTSLLDGEGRCHFHLSHIRGEPYHFFTFSDLNGLSAPTPLRLQPLAGRSLALLRLEKDDDFAAAVRHRILLNRSCRLRLDDERL